eukprot:TRINITY_DN9909_c0_g1_i1.p1 TRINITY_DN9909_c0_g1~~TRINITY_DN9909_c0_g1_i1.p1  ORF type:complete len:3393 (+),score=755.95 TRINITY_DN9909_c0_g1_i1:131-10309(+)
MKLPFTTTTIYRRRQKKRKKQHKMGNCGGKAYSGHHKVAAEHQAAMNEASAVVEKQIQNDIERDVKRVEQAAAEAMKAAEAAKAPKEEGGEAADTAENGDEEEARMTRLKEAQASLKKATRRLNKLEALKAAKECGAIDQDDYNAAVRRLTAITGIDPTSDRQHSLPEGCEWLTTLLDCLWPSIRAYSRRLMHDTIQPIINSECEKYGVSCVIDKFDLGSNNPAFGPIEGRYVGPNASKESLEISIGITVHSNMCVSMTTTAGNVGIQNYSFAGKLFLTLRSFLDKPPFVGAVGIAFANPPRLDLDWTGVVGFFSSVQPVIIKAVNDFIADLCVLPNRIVVPLVQNNPKVDIAKLSRPTPEGVLSLSIINCQNCPAKQLLINTKSSIRVRIGAQTWTTKETRVTSDGTLWINDSSKFLVFNKDQWVVIELMEGFGGDQVVGEILNIPVNRLVKRREATIPFTKKMFPVTNDSGEATAVTVKAQWLRLNNSITNSPDGSLCSVELGEVRGLPKLLATRGPFRISGSAGQAPRISPPGGTKPGTSTTPKELLRLIRSHAAEKPIQIARAHQMEREGDLQLIKQALSRHDGEYVIQAPSDQAAKWQTEAYLLDYQLNSSKLLQTWRDDGVKESAIAEREKWYEKFATYVEWTKAVEETRRLYHESKDPYIGSSIHLWCNKVDKVVLKLLDNAGLTVAEGTLTVSDNTTGDEADMVGPFDLQLKHPIGSGKTIQVSGQIIIRSLEQTDTLPTNWCLEADALVAKDDFTEWWQHEVYVADWLDWKTLKESNMDTDASSKLEPSGKIGTMWMSNNWPGGDKSLAPREVILERDTFYRHGVTKTTPAGMDPDHIREKSLRQCLDAGALTWGDYDVLMGKLHGDSGASTIAETLEWLNMIISATWPGVVKYTAHQLKHNIEPQINKSISPYGASAVFTKVSLGAKEPAFGTIQCKQLYATDKAGNQVMEGCELIFNDMSFISQIDIQLAATVLGKTVSGGIRNLHFKGSVIVTLKPVLAEQVPPFFGAIEMTLRNPPMLDLIFTGDIGRAFDGVAGAVSNFKSTFNDMVIQSISKSCVIPNTIVMPLSDHPSVDMAHLSCPRPVGILRLTISECLHLPAADKSTSLTGAKTASSDAYVIVKLGNQTVRSEQITSLNPRFNFTTDLVVYHEEQAVDIEVWDNNKLMPDVSLGALFHKGVVLGGGTDEIKRGIPVRGLRALRKGTLNLQVKELDSLLTTRSNLVYTLNNAIGESQCPSVIVVETEWLTQRDEAKAADSLNKSFILSACIRSAESIRTASGKQDGPYTVRVSAGGETVETKQGDGNSGCLGAKDLLATVAEAFNNHANEEDALLRIMKSTQITKELAKEAQTLPISSLSESDLAKVSNWHTRCVNAIAAYRQNTSPDFNQVVHAAFKSSRDSDLAGGTWTCPVTIELVGKSGRTICSAEKHVAVSSIADPSVKGLLALTGEGSCRLRCEISLTGFKGIAFDPQELSEDEQVLRMEPFNGPEYIATPHGTQPKIGQYVVARNLVKMIELNWKVSNKKKGEPIRRGDRPQPEGKVVAWTQDGSRAVVDFGHIWGEWNVRPRNLCLAPPPLPPPPPPEVLHIVCPEIFSCEGEYRLSSKKARNQPVWRLEGIGDDAFTMKIYSDEEGRWVCAPEGCAPYLRTLQQHEGRFPHMMRHAIDSNVELSSIEQPLDTGIVWQIQNETWEDSPDTKCQIEKPIAEEHEEVIDEMIDDVMDDIAADLEADLLADLEEDLIQDVEEDVGGDIEGDIDLLLDDQSFPDDDEEEAAALAAQEADRLEAERQAEEDREAERLEAERAAQEAEEAERLAREAEARRLEEEEQKRAAEEAERQARIEAERKMKEEERKEAERKRLEEEEKKRREEDERKRKEAEAKAKAEAEKKKKEEEERKRKEAEEKKKREEAEKKRKAAEEAARKKREEEERKRREEEERRKREEARKKKAEEERQKAEAARKARKAANRKGKMETLNKALEIGAMSKSDFATALRRLQAITGEDPTNEGRAYTLPETMQWLSTTLSVLWPHIKVFLTNELQTICSEALEKVSKDVSMGPIDLGNETPGFGPVSVKYLDGESGDVELGLGINYLSNVDLKFKTENGTVSVQKLKCVGTMYFWLRSFMDKWPFVGGLQCAFVNPPTLKFVFGTSNPHRKSQMSVQKALTEALQKSCVVPNFVTVPFGDGGLEYFATPKPQGVVKITVVKCNDLEALDAGFNPSSDPYVVASVGTKTRQTEYISENLDPVWTSGNEFKFLVYNPDQWVVFDVYDYDEDEGDDHIGSVVGLPINRLVTRCLENPDGIAIPLTKDGKPVQGETGEVSTLTVKAEWLTIDSNILSADTKEESSLVRIALEDLSELPSQLSGPFRVRASSGKDVAVSRCSAVQASTKSSRDILSCILKMHSAGRSASFISKVLSFPLHLVKEAVKTSNCDLGATVFSIVSEDLSPEKGYSGWFASADGFLANQSNNEKPQFLDNIYLNLPTLCTNLRLEVLDSNDTVIGNCSMPLSDEATGEEADVVGPFEIQIPSARVTASINADITVQSLKNVGIPNTWNARSKNHKSMGDKRKLKGNEDLIKKNAGGKLTDEKEIALNDCLKAGSLTWGDYDILVGKLRGEGDGFSIAETLEWVNMLINRIWPHYRKYLEKKMNATLDDQLVTAIAAIPGSSMAGLSLKLAKPPSLGAKAPSFSTINADKIKTHHGYDGLKLTFNNVQFNSNIEVDLIGSAAGVEVTVAGKDVKLQSTMCVEISHFSETIPFVGYVEAYFPNPPQIDLSLSVAGFGGLGPLCSYVAGRAIGDVMVLPNTANTYLGESAKTEGTVSQRDNKIKPVIGVLRLSVIRAKSLIAGDMAVAMLRSANSDSYTAIKLGVQNQKTKIVKSLDPEWHEQFDLVVRDMSQWLDLEVFDSDLKSDDPLGSVLHKEIVLGGGTDLICRGIPISALVQKMWSPDNRNREYFSLPLSQRVVDEDLSIRDGPYIGARIEFTGGGKYPANEALVTDTTTIPVGCSGVVESVDKSTKPFHSFKCTFDSPEPVILHALDVKVTQPKIVWKMVPCIGEDGNESKIHIHGEWLAPDAKGPGVAQLVKICTGSIAGSPPPEERDLGLPYSIKYTLQVVRKGTVGSEDDWKTLTTKQSGPAVESTVTLPSMLKSLDTMWSETTTKSDEEKIKDIATCLSITPELVKEGIELSDSHQTAVPQNDESKSITLIPVNKHNKKTYKFTMYKSESEKDARRRLRATLLVKKGFVLSLKQQGADLPNFEYDAVTADEVHFSSAMTQASSYWISRVRDHINSVRAAEEPTINDTLTMTSPSQEKPHILIELLNNKSTVLGSTKVIPLDDVYPSGPYSLTVEQEASGGMFGFGKTEGYNYTFEIDASFTTKLLKSQS